MTDWSGDRAVTTLRMPADVWAGAIGHLRSALPHEGVGLLAVEPEPGPVARGSRFYPGTNIDASPVRYTMAPAEVLAAFRDMETAGLRFGAIIHSHPETAPVPSDTDRRESYYPDVALVIVGWLATEPVARAWRTLRAADGEVAGFAEVELVIDAGQPGARREAATGGGGGGADGAD